MVYVTALFGVLGTAFMASYAMRLRLRRGENDDDHRLGSRVDTWLDGWFGGGNRRGKHNRAHRRKHTMPLTVLDATTPTEAVALVRHFSGDRTTSDELLTKLVGVFQTFVPVDRSMAMMYTENERLAGSGGEEAFAVATVYAAMRTAIRENSKRHGFRRRGGDSSRIVRIVHCGSPKPGKHIWFEEK